LLVAVRVVFPSKAYAATVEAEQALIADGDAVYSGRDSAANF
jgi:hypothetical protein